MLSDKYACVHTIGCQMNVYDSQKLAGILTRMGYKMTQSLETADIVVCNTCAIRHKSEEKAFSFLGRLAGEKQKNPHLITVMAGCVAQQEGSRAFSRLPHLDIVLGTQAFERFPSHIKAIKSGRKQITDIKDAPAIFESLPDEHDLDASPVSRFVTIMQGCDNYCTYCVVPHVRGRERSRSPEAILDEITSLSAAGVREVTLLGQNVNSYGIKENMISFAGLLELVNQVPGIERIRFATSHPKDLSFELMNAIAGLEKVCHHLHLPVQSGADRILKKMNRGYTRSKYLDLIDRLKKTCPDIALSTDIIVGFPSETRQDFEDTLSLLNLVRFDSIFAFAYSNRSNAPAARFPGQVDEAVKKERLNTLLDCQASHTEKKNQAMAGRIEPVLVEGKSRKPREGHEEDHRNEYQMMGRTRCNKIVHFSTRHLPSGQKVRAGDCIDIIIENAYPHSLWGTPSGA